MKEEVGLTDTLHNLVAQISMREKQIVHKMLNHYISEYKRARKEVDEISTAASFHTFIDEQIVEQFKQPEAKNVKCSKGCSYCCEQIVDITEDEAKLIYQYVTEENIQFSKTKLKLQSKLTVDNWTKQSRANRTCVFLNDKNECNVYKYRPSSCRKLFVITDPELCNNEEVQKVERFVNIHVEIIASAALNASKGDSMPKLLMKLIKK